MSSPTETSSRRIDRAANRQLGDRDDALRLVADVDEHLVLVHADDGAVDDLPLLDGGEGRLVVGDELAALGIGRPNAFLEPRIVDGLVGHTRGGQYSGPRPKAGATLPRMEERYPIGVTASCSVAVLRQDGAESGYGGWSATIGLLSGEATVRVPGHYAGLLGDVLRGADERFAPGARLARDEYLDVTGLIANGLETVALSSTARSPVRVTVEVPRGRARGARGAARARAGADRDAPARTRARAGLPPRGAVSLFGYARAGARVAERALSQRPQLGHEERLVFVVGCPRSGTTFLGRAIGGLPGFIDLSAR